MLKGRLREAKSNFSFRQVLVVIQFAISIALIIGTFTALRQVKFMQNKPLGYDKDNLMVVPVESNDVITHFDAFKNDLLKNPIIESVAASQKVPAEREYSDMGWETDVQKEMFISRFFAVDFGFLEAYKVEMAAGRAFDENNSTDTDFRIIINETAAKKLGYATNDEAIGGKFHSEWLGNHIDSNAVGKIIGVTKDFHFQSMKNKIEPLAMFVSKDWINRISIRYAPENKKEAIEYVEKTWKDHFPDVQFTYEFINDYLRTFYKAEENLQSILWYLPFLL